MNANFLNCDDAAHLLWVSCVVLRWARIQGKVVLSHLEYILRAEVEAQTCLSKIVVWHEDCGGVVGVGGRG